MPPILVVVPVHLGAFHLATDGSVLEAMADFDRLPYGGTEQDIHRDVANLNQDLEHFTEA